VLHTTECVSFNYKIIYVSAKHAGSTLDSTAAMSTPLHTLLDWSEADGGLSDWASVASDNAYGNGSACCWVHTPFPGALSVLQLLLVELADPRGAGFWRHRRPLGNTMVADAVHAEEGDASRRSCVKAAQMY
jgi:hypothetical protein